MKKNKIALMFAGQGAQYVGMGKEIYDLSAEARAVFGSFEKKRKGTTEQCFYGTDEELALTINAQPCILAVELAIAAAIKVKGIKADSVCGFSLGELAAIQYSGMLSLDEIIDLVIFRAEEMNKCCNMDAGTMAAVMRADASCVSRICKKYDKACIANYNSDSQITISCAVEDYEKIEAELKSNGAMVIKLNVSGAFHSEFMTAAAENMEEYLSKIVLKKAVVDCYSNVTADIFDDKLLIARQINNSVRWNEILDRLLGRGVNKFLEIGPGNVLTGLIKRKTKTVEAFSINDKASLEAI